MQYEVLLFYKYVHIEDPETVMMWQKELCTRLGLKGRLIIAREGLNITLEGTRENTRKYIKEISKHPKFQNIHFKRSAGTGDAFPKLSVKVRDEIVSLHLGDEDIDPNQVTGKHIPAEELHNLIHNSDEEYYIIDMRNDYEHKSGHFEGSILPAMENFRDLPKLVQDLAHLKDKKVITVCTGGVRCEKASGYLVSQGFTDVSQLDGGIVSYMEKYPNQDFLGKLYVFDKRILMGFDVDKPEHQVIGVCERCGAKSENYINCANLACHKHLIVCEDCIEQDGAGYCSEECRQTANANLRESETHEANSD